MSMKCDTSCPCSGGCVAHRLRVGWSVSFSGEGAKAGDSACGASLFRFLQGRLLR
jgi:hypothetical protein